MYTSLQFWPWTLTVNLYILVFLFHNLIVHLIGFTYSFPISIYWIQVFDDTGIARDVGNLQIMCSRNEKGCTWKGDLRNMQVIMCVCMCTGACACMCACAWMCACACMRECMHACVHVCTPERVCGILVCVRACVWI